LGAIQNPAFPPWSDGSTDFVALQALRLIAFHALPRVSTPSRAEPGCMWVATAVVVASNAKHVEFDLERRTAGAVNGARHYEGRPLPSVYAHRAAAELTRRPQRAGVADAPDASAPS
jgi:hypothetical protein